MSRRTSALLALLFAAVPLTAQGRVLPRSMISLNPLGIPWDIISGEFETTTGAGMTAGISASYTDIEDRRFSTFDVKGRYYPGEQVFNRLSVGLSGGYTKFDARNVFFNQNGQSITRASMSAPTLGVLIDYNFVHGGNRRFVVGTGIAAKRVIASAERRATVDLGRAYMTGRFVIGWAY